MHLPCLARGLQQPSKPLLWRPAISIRRLIPGLLLGAALLDSPSLRAEPFTFHDLLEQSVTPLNGNANLAAKLYEGASGGSQLGTTVSPNSCKLTVTGECAQAAVSKKLEEHRLENRSSGPKVEVSGQVTGSRKDAWAEENRILVERTKSGDERGKFLHPEAHGQPVGKRVGIGDGGKG